MLRRLLFWTLLLLIPLASAEVEADHTLIKVLNQQGSVAYQEVTFSNTGGQIETITLSIVGDADVSIDKDSMTLPAGESDSATLTFNAIDTAGVYTAQLLAGSLIIPIILEVESQEVSYDVKLSLPAEASPGDEVLYDISTLDLSRQGGSASLTYEISLLNSDGEVVLSETLLDKQNNFIYGVQLPKNLTEGYYTAIVKVLYSNSVGLSSQLIYLSIAAPPVENSRSSAFFWIIGAGVVMLLTAMVYSFSKRREPLVSENVLAKFKQKIAAKKAAIGNLPEPPQPPAPLQETLEATETKIEDISRRVDKLEPPESIEEEPLAPIEDELIEEELPEPVSTPVAEPDSSLSVEPEPEGDEVFVSAEQYHALLQRISYLSQTVSQIQQNLASLNGVGIDYVELGNKLTAAQESLRRLGAELSQTRQMRG